MREWYVKKNNQKIGPISEAQLKESIRRKFIHEDDLIETQEIGKWIFVRDIPQLQQIAMNSKKTQKISVYSGFLGLYSNKNYILGSFFMFLFFLVNRAKTIDSKMKLASFFVVYLISCISLFIILKFKSVETYDDDDDINLPVPVPPAHIQEIVDAIQNKGSVESIERLYLNLSEKDREWRFYNEINFKHNSALGFVSEKGDSFLHLVAYSGNTELVDVFVKHCFKLLRALNAEKHSPITQLISGIRSRDLTTKAVNMIKALKNAGMALKNEKEANSPLQMACFQSTFSVQSIELVRVLLDLGADPNYVGECKSTPFYQAATHAVGDSLAHTIEVLTLLLERGANPYLGDGHNSPLEYAKKFKRDAGLVDFLENAQRVYSSKSIKIPA